MEERRSFERIRCYYYLKVYDLKTRRDIGSIINISLRGMKVISEYTFTEGTKYNFGVKLPEGSVYGKGFKINAEVRWSGKKEEENYYEAGFKFLHFDKKGVMVVKSLIYDFKKKALL